MLRGVAFEDMADPCESTCLTSVASEDLVVSEGRSGGAAGNPFLEVVVASATCRPLRACSGTSRVAER